MKLIEFSVTNYKIFKEEFNINFTKDSVAILTGRNNTGKSTILEAINRFYQKETKAKSIPSDCFSDKNKEIILKAKFVIDNESLTIIKKYKDDNSPKFYDKDDIEINARHEQIENLNLILNNKPFYITPSMLPEDINSLVQEIYSEILKNNIYKIENIDQELEEDSELLELAKEYEEIKKSYPKFLNKLKINTDKKLQKVSEGVSENLQDLFSNEDLFLNVLGGESEGFSSTDILKTTNSTINIDSNQQSEMPLSNQGTGIQRMSLIYLIQNMIQKKLIGGNENKLLLIDEPEAFLHPEAIRALSRSLYKIGEKMPLMISTHSPVLIDLSERHTSIQVFRVGEQKAVQLYQSTQVQFDKNDIKNMKILNYVDSYINEFFFADKILIVEGDTEYIAFKHLAKYKNVNIHIIRARGKGTIYTLMKILNQFNTNYTVIHDVDNNPDFTQQTLKAQRTTCCNIFDLKGNDVNIFASNIEFEHAIGIGSIANDKKTQTIYEIMHDTTENREFKEALKKIEELFDQIIGGNNEGSLSSGFHKIENKEEYDEFFKNLIELK